MARNRKRAKERRDRRPQTVASRSSLSGNGEVSEGIPSPIEHATPDAELADAQLAMGRMESLQEDPDSAAELEPAGEGGGGDGLQTGAGFDDGSGSEPPGGDAGEIALPQPGAGPHAEGRPRNRLLAFLEGSWRELQRVQWPDRRQVMQATAVVLGFVIVAGLVLALSDTLASHLMSYVLTGTHSVLAWVAIAVIVLSLAGWMFADRDR